MYFFIRIYDLLVLLIFVVARSILDHLSPILSLGVSFDFDGDLHPVTRQFYQYQSPGCDFVWDSHLRFSRFLTYKFCILIFHFYFNLCFFLNFEFLGKPMDISEL